MIRADQPPWNATTGVVVLALFGTGGSSYLPLIFLLRQFKRQSANRLLKNEQIQG
jgi:hypothetical protein